MARPYDPVKKKEQHRKYFEAHKEEIRARDRKRSTTPEHRAKRRAYYAKNRESWNKQQRDKNRANPLHVRLDHIKATFGLTKEQYFSMLDSSGGRCAICGELPRPMKNGRTGLNIDHCHGTGATRGLVCHHCNRGLAGFKDDISRLRAAMEYLMRFEGPAPCL